MEYTSIQFSLALLGTFICLFGFFVRRKVSLDLLRPRFVVPGLIFIATFAHVIVGYFSPPGQHESIAFHDFKLMHGSHALLYICICMLCFWLGYALPIGRAVGNKMGGLAEAIYISDGLLRFIGLGITALLIFLIVIVSGPSVLNSEWGSFGIAPSFLRAGNIGTLIFLLILLAAGCFGLSFPGFLTRPILSGIMLASALVLCVPLMANFSRGSGLPFMVMAVGYMIRYRRIKWPVLIGVFFLTACLSHAGLTGRGIYGHGGGLLPFWYHAITFSVMRPIEVLWIPLSAANSVTPLATTMAAISSETDIRLLTPLEWLLLQIPLPRRFGIHPEWTPSLPLFVGGQGAWDYTFGIFGDIYGHLGWFGVLIFIYVGIAYRTVSAAAFDSRAALFGIMNPYYLWLATSYFAMFMGLFNNFRAWQVTFFYPLYLILIAVTVMRFFKIR